MKLLFRILLFTICLICSPLLVIFDWTVSDDNIEKVIKEYLNDCLSMCRLKEEK